MLILLYIIKSQWKSLMNVKQLGEFDARVTTTLHTFSFAKQQDISYFYN